MNWVSNKLFFTICLFVHLSMAEYLNCRFKPGCDGNRCDPSPSSLEQGFGISDYLKKKEFPITCEQKKEVSSDVARLYSENADNRYEIKQLRKEVQTLTSEIESLKKGEIVFLLSELNQLRKINDEQTKSIENLKKENAATGQNKKRDSNPCDTNPCGNNAICKRLGNEKYDCKCQKPYTRNGPTCEIKDGQLRLAGGNSDSEGRLEVFHAGEWGTICGYLWGMDEAYLACRELGFNKAKEAGVGFRFGEGKGKIWLISIHCDREVTQFESCRGVGKYGPYNALCTHDNDASVVCE
ncbi:uncharacterized protein LOC120333179 isoform X1 [Styela clava]